MLNINQNFDLKAPVFNFDRDYFNSVEELNAYDTSNVPDHFVTNVAGMLYQFTDGKWLPMIGTEYDNDSLHYVNLGCPQAYLEIDTQNYAPISLWLCNTSGRASLSPTLLSINRKDTNRSVSINTNYNGSGAGITVSGDSTSNTIVTNSQIICGDDSFKVDIYGDEGRMEINDAQGRFTNYSASGFSVQTKDNTKSIKLDINDTEADNDYGSPVNVSLTDNINDVININVVDGFSHINSNGNYSNLYSTGLDIYGGTCQTTIYADQMTMYSNDTDSNIEINTNKELTEEEQNNGYSHVDISLTDGDYSANINASHGFMHKTEDGFTSRLDGETLDMYSQISRCTINSCGLYVHDENNEEVIYLSSFEGNSLALGSDKKFKISRPTDNTEGATITGIKSLTAFANPSATKVWATDGSTINMPTKFSDLTNDNVYITGNKGETAARFKITYNDDGVLRSQLQYGLRKASTCIPELGFKSYDTSGNPLSQIRIRPEDNRDDGQYVIQVQDVRGSKVNCVSSIVPNSFQVLNNETNTAAEFASNELIFYTHNNDFQVQLKINKEGITKTNGKATEVFAANGSIIDLTNYFNGTTTVDKLKSKAVEVIDATNSVTVSPTGITATNGSATKVFATDGSTVDLTTKANTSDLATKANASDVLLKKNSRGGYYIGDSNDYVGSNAFSIGGNTADGSRSFAEGYDTKAYGSYSHVEGQYTEAGGESAHAEGDFTFANGNGSHSEGRYTHAIGSSSHAEGHGTRADGFASHAQGAYNIANKNAIHSVGIGNSTTRKNAEYIYAKNNEYSSDLVDDPKNGYKYLIGVGGYDGISTDNSTYKSVQEVIADLTARIEQLEKLTVNCVSISNVDEQTN